jgi:UDP-N-acetylmuramate--L-alanine ligase
MWQKSRELPRRVHLLGIGGAGMSGLAHCLLALKRDVSGSDLQRSAETDDLSSLGATIFYDHSADNVAHAELVVVSDAISPYNLELEAARQKDIPILRRAECLDRLCAQRTSVFVAGSHGKSTTSGMIAKVLDAAGAEPSFVIGATVPSLGNQRARIGRGIHFVAEACEAFRNLAFFHPTIAVITNIDDEHLEYYGSQEALDRAFEDFAARAGPGGAVIVNGDDPGVRRILPALNAPVTTFGIQTHNDISTASHAFDGAGCRFEVRIRGATAGTISIPFPGEHTLCNALGCIAACDALGIPFDRIAEGLAAFTGVSRRWEDHGVANGVRIIDDYAHHPTELAAIVHTARSVVGNDGRLVVAFQPQLFSRTQRLYRAFARVLAGCDHVLLLEIDPAGERDAGAIRGSLVLDEIRRLGGFAEGLTDVDELVDRAPQVVRSGDLLLICGAGSIRAAAARLCRRLASNGAEVSSLRFPDGERRPNAREFVRAIGSRFRSIIDRETTVISLFRMQARRRPAGCAISEGRRTLRYGELNEITDALAGILHARGAVRGAAVGVRLPASIDLVVIMLALMKAGAVYLPLDESLPRERVRYMLTKARAKLLVTSGDVPFRAELGEFETLCLADLQGDLDRLPTRSAAGGAWHWAFAPAANEPAYICFTSGSTGYPKGITIRHQALYRLIADITPRFHIGPKTRTVMNTSISFDVSLAEIWMTLCGGGQLNVSGSPKSMVGDRLGRFLDENEITHLAVTPSVLASIGAKSLPALRCIVCAGEACPQELVDTWAPNRHFFNAYGPTEATIYATVAQCRAGTKVTIGKALGHINTYVLGDDLKSVPDGEMGELCLGGGGVSDSYLDLEEETRQKFLMLHGDGKSIDRIYRTGDLVRRERDGNLAFLGRVDNQIKIRGNRIELEEIEHSVKRLTGVVDAAACIDESSGAKELVCFVVIKSDHDSDVRAIPERLSEWLPSYMVPSHFVRVDAIPLTASGKKDRRSLLPKCRARIVRRTEYAAPRNEIEQKLAAIWKSLLEAESEVGMYDSFASLGGDSLKSLMLIEEVEQYFGVMAPPGYFGGISTVYRMAVQIADLLWNNRNEAVCGSEFRSSRIYKQLRDLTAGWVGVRVNEASLISSLGKQDAICDLFVCVQDEAEFVALSRHIHQAVRTHCMRSGHLVMDYTGENIERLAAYYLEEIEQIEPKGKLVIVGICQGSNIAHAVANKLRQRGADVAMLVCIEQARPLPFDGNVAFFYADESPLNPRTKGGFARYDGLYGTRYSVDFVPGEHGLVCKEPSVRFLAAKLENRLAPFLGD